METTNPLNSEFVSFCSEMSSEVKLSVYSDLSLLPSFRSIKEPDLSPFSSRALNLASLIPAHGESTAMEGENLTSSLNVLDSKPFEINFNASMFEERILVTALFDSSINSMNYSTSTADYDTTNLFELKDE